MNIIQKNISKFDNFKKTLEEENLDKVSQCG